MQLLASFKNPAHGAQSHLKFSKIQGSSEPHVQKSFKLCQKLHLILLTMPVLKYKRLRLKLRVFLVGHSVAMITYCHENNTNVFTNDWTVFGYHDYHQLIKSDNNGPSKSTSWKALETVLSHFI